MEYGLGPIRKAKAAYEKTVLILVLMEYGLGQLQVRTLHGR